MVTYFAQDTQTSVAGYKIFILEYPFDPIIQDKMRMERCSTTIILVIHLKIFRLHVAVVIQAMQNIRRMLSGQSIYCSQDVSFTVTKYSFLVVVE